MTRTNETYRYTATGNGATTVYNTGITTSSSSDIKVYLAGSLRTITTHYTVTTGTNTQVTFLSAPSNGAAIVIIKDVPATQTTDFTNESSMPRTLFEAAIDKLTDIAQSQQEKIDRCVSYNQLSTTDLTSIPLEDVTANYYLYSNEDADGISSIAPTTSSTITTNNLILTGALTTTNINGTGATTITGITTNTTATNVTSNIKLYDSDSSNYLQLNSAATSNVTYTLPSAAPTIFNTILTDGAGTLSFGQYKTKMSLIGSISPSGANLDITIDSTSYDHYIIYVTGVRASSGTVDFRATTSTDGTNFDSGASDYVYNVIARTTVDNGSTTSTGDSKLLLTPATFISTSMRCTFIIKVIPANGSRKTTIISENLQMGNPTATTNTTAKSTGYRNSTTAITKLRLAVSSGTLTITSCYAYGVSL